MININPIVSLFQLLINALKSLDKENKLKKERDMQRKIIELQLSLEDIIDSAKKILLFIQKNKNLKQIKKDMLFSFRDQLYDQSHRLKGLLTLLEDGTSNIIMKLFTPEIRRDIAMLIDRKGGVVSTLIWNLHDLIDKYFPYTDKDSYEWDLSKIIRKALQNSSGNLTNIINTNTHIDKWIDEQNQTINALIKCSSDLSQFIKTQMNINDILFYRL
jgi:hypothetical protein